MKCAFDILKIVLVRTFSVGHVKESSLKIRIPTRTLENLEKMTKHDLNGLK